MENLTIVSPHLVYGLEGMNLANGGSWMQWVYGQPPGPKKSSSSAINGGSLDLR